MTREIISDDILPPLRYFVHVDFETARTQTLEEARAWARERLVPYKICGIRDSWQNNKTVEHWSYLELPPVGEAA